MTSEHWWLDNKRKVNWTVQV